MAVVRGFLDFAGACRNLCVLVVLVLVVIQPYRASGLNWRGSFATSKAVVNPPVGTGTGICAASAIAKHGYKCEEHQVTTKDGYILGLLRIPEGRVAGNASAGSKRQPVLMQHGVLVDGMSWLGNASPEQNLPTILADNGLDVWITNTRGTRFSRRHTCLDPNTQDFWDWTWDELGAFDLPAVLAFVSSQTGVQKIDYVGHSQGTLIALTSLTEGRLVNHMKSAALLSPVAYLSHMTTLVGTYATQSFLGEINTVYGLPEFNPRGATGSAYINALCAYPGVNCYDMLSDFTGPNCCLDSSAMDDYMNNEPQSTSSKNLEHLAQTVRSCVVAKYDYANAEDNTKHYGKATAPVYNLANIPKDFPLLLSYGGQDALSDVEDVKHFSLLNDIKAHDKAKLSVQFIENYARLDFIMAVNAKEKVYNPVVTFFKAQKQDGSSSEASEPE